MPRALLPGPARSAPRNAGPRPALRLRRAQECVLPIHAATIMVLEEHSVSPDRAHPRQRDRAPSAPETRRPPPAPRKEAVDARSLRSQRYKPFSWLQDLAVTATGSPHLRGLVEFTTQASPVTHTFVNTGRSHRRSSGHSKFGFVAGSRFTTRNTRSSSTWVATT